MFLERDGLICKIDLTKKCGGGVFRRSNTRRESTYAMLLTRHKCLICYMVPGVGVEPTYHIVVTASSCISFSTQVGFINKIQPR